MSRVVKNNSGLRVLVTDIESTVSIYSIKKALSDLAYLPAPEVSVFWSKGDIEELEKIVKYLKENV